MGHGLLPHAVTRVDGSSTGYAYDANGEMTQDADRSLSWTAFGKAGTITKGNNRIGFTYGPDDARYQKTLKVSGLTTESVTYLGAAEVLTVNYHTSIRRTLALADVSIIDTGGYGAKVLYPVTDHLGSVMAMSDGSGALAREMSYGPFGQRKTAGWSAYMTISAALTINETETDRGYTGQEALDAVQLDDYNARLYDPRLGRFLSVDPLIGHPESTQGINPYSYVENNPLNKVDPTGGMDQCLAEGHCSGVTIEGMGSIGRENTGNDPQSSNSKKKPTADPTPTPTGTKNPNADNDPKKHTGITNKDKKDGDSTSKSGHSAAQQGNSAGDTGAANAQARDNQSASQKDKADDGGTSTGRVILTPVGKVTYELPPKTATGAGPAPHKSGGTNAKVAGVAGAYGAGGLAGAAIVGRWALRIVTEEAPALISAAFESEGVVGVLVALDLPVEVALAAATGGLVGAALLGTTVLIGVLAYAAVESSQTQPRVQKN